MPKIQQLTRNQKALVISISLLVAMSTVRLYHFTVSGFMTSDEGLYILAGVLSAERNTVVIAYPNRIPYQIVLGFFGWVFNLDNVYSMMYFAVGFDLFCSILSVFLSYKIIDTFLPKHAKYSFIYILLIPTLIIFDVATVAVLTESMSYVFLLFGVYSLFRAIQDKSIVSALLSGASFGLIYFTREPYAVVAVGGLLVAFALTLKKRFNKKQLLVFCLFSLLFFRVPSSSGPVNLTNYLPIEASRFFVQQWNQITASATPEPNLVDLLPQDVHSTEFIANSTNSTLFESEQKVTEMYVSSEYKGAMTSWTGLFPSPYKIGYTVYSTVVGMSVGWNPLVFGLAVFGLAQILKRSYRKTVYEKLILTFSFFSVLVTVGSIYISAFPSPDQLSAGITLPYGTMVRLSHPSLFATFLALPALKKVEPMFHKKRFLGAIVLVGIVATATFMVAINSFQAQWSSGYVNRLNFHYRSPYLKAYDYFQTSGKTLVFGGVNIVQLSLFARNMDSVFLSRPPANESDMEFLVQQENWDTVVIIGTTHYTSQPALREFFPFFWELLSGNTSYGISVIFETGEAYFYEVVLDQKG